MIITDGSRTVRIEIRVWNYGYGFGEDISNDVFEDVPKNGINEDESDRVGFDVYNVKDVSYCIDYANDFMKSVNTAGSDDNVSVSVYDLSEEGTKCPGYLYIEKNENESYYNFYLICNKYHSEIKLRKAEQFIYPYSTREVHLDSYHKIGDYNISPCMTVPAQFANLFMNGYNDTAVKLFKRLGFEVVFKNPFEGNL